MSECMTPYITKARNKMGTIPVPCGKCPACCKRRASAWSIRLKEERKRSSSAYFITLTYSNYHVPITESGFMSLDKRDVQLFFMRLRKVNAPGIKYYCVGEYGSKTLRPHYHIILFNADVKTIQSAWNLGQVHYGQVEGASIGYTLKYISKPRQIPAFENDDRAREFALMSKGLGDNYINRMVHWHHADLDNRMYVPLEGGKKACMPRYYKEKMYVDSERKRIGQVQLSKIQQRVNDEMSRQGDMYFTNQAEARKAAIRFMRKTSGKGDKV